MYGFDLDSNRTQISENGQTVATYAYDATKLDVLSSVTQGGQQQVFGYDADGNTTARGQDTLSWDGRGRHSGGSFSGTSVSYAFDAGGFRRLRTGAGTTTHYRLGGLYETTSNGTITNTGIDSPIGDVAHYAGAPTTSTTYTVRYYTGDGDLAAEADGSGARTAAYSYDPFGTLRSGSAPSNATSERWTGGHGKKLDTTSSLIEMGARPYDPSLGRFLALDPVEGGSANTYDFAAQDPVNNSDVSGAACNAKNFSYEDDNIWAQVYVNWCWGARVITRVGVTTRFAVGEPHTSFGNFFAYLVTGEVKYWWPLPPSIREVVGAPGSRSASIEVVFQQEINWFVVDQNCGKPENWLRCLDRGASRGVQRCTITFSLVVYAGGVYGSPAWRRSCSGGP